MVDGWYMVYLSTLCFSPCTIHSSAFSVEPFSEHRTVENSLKRPPSFTNDGTGTRTKFKKRRRGGGKGFKLLSTEPITVPLTSRRPSNPQVVNEVMKEWGVPVRGLVPLMLCASAAARMPLAGKAAFANHAMCCSSRRGLHAARGSSGNNNNSNSRHWARMLAHGSRLNSGDSATGALRFSSSSSGGGNGGDSVGGDELDACVKAAVGALPSRPRVAVVGGEFLLHLEVAQQPGYRAKRGVTDQACLWIQVSSHSQYDSSSRHSSKVNGDSSKCIYVFM